MPPTEPSPSPLKPAMPAAWQWILRVTGLVTILLFLTPTFYVVKYYALDLPREGRVAHSMSAWQRDLYNPDDLPAEAEVAKAGPDTPTRLVAVRFLGETLRRPGVGWKRPMECLSAKATLADLAAREPNPQVRALASYQLQRVAQGGAVIER